VPEQEDPTFPLNLCPADRPPTREASSDTQKLHRFS